MVFGRVLKKFAGYNLRERLNVYGGALLGIAVPTAIVRYALFPYEDTSLIESIAKWGVSLVASIPISINTSLGGLMVGIYTANGLQTKRVEKERENSNLVQIVENTIN